MITGEVGVDEGSDLKEVATEVQEPPMESPTPRPRRMTFG
jgi:hypothetical protein